LQATAAYPAWLHVERVKARDFVRNLHRKTGITEFVFLDLCQKMEDKLESYRPLAEELL
jgi:hypothetical protein